MRGPGAAYLLVLLAGLGLLVVAAGMTGSDLPAALAASTFALGLALLVTQTVWALRRRRRQGADVTGVRRTVVRALVGAGLGLVVGYLVHALTGWGEPLYGAVLGCSFALASIDDHDARPRTPGT